MVKYIVISLLTVIMLPIDSGAQSFYTVRPDGSGDAPTIQAAIDMAVSGDVILVYVGDYYEDDLLVEGKDIVLDALDGIPVIISSNPYQGTGITFRNTGASTSMTGFEFREFEKGMVIEDSDGLFWYSSFISCTRGIEIMGFSSAPSIMFSLVDFCGTGVSVISGSGILVRNMTIVNADTGVESFGGSSIFNMNIIYGCTAGFTCTGGSISLNCNNLYLNTTDYIGCVAGTGDFYELPRFCFEAEGSPGLYYLHIDSPCWAENNLCGVDVGMFTAAPGCVGTAILETSWGAIKKMYR